MDKGLLQIPLYLVECSRDNVVLPSANLVHGSANEVNRSDADAQVTVILLSFI